jgi:HEAT repeat protein
MRRAAIVVAMLAGAAVAGGAMMMDPQNTLTAIDTVPSADQINCAFHGSASGSGTCLSALPDLESLAANGSADPGERLRAIHALVAYYCPTTPCSSSDPAHDAVTSLVTSYQSAHAGFDLLVLRASIESLGLMRVASDSAQIKIFLSHSSRDIRAVTARTLGQICATDAVTDLRNRYQQEPTEQVRLAISDALGVLATCTGP